jgi:peptide/nickel transport system substrate-binding protein
MATRIVMVLLALTLALVIACGGAPAAPDPTATSPAAPASDATPTTAPTAPVASDTAQPTSTPQMVAPPAEVEVNPGKLTIMVGDLSTERFDTIFARGGQGNRVYGRILHGFLISDNEKREMMPGIASQWDMSADGLTWTFTIREGVKFHNGSEVTPEDVLWTLQHYYGPQAFEYVTSVAATLSRAMDRIELTGTDRVSLTTKEPRTDFAAIVSEAGDVWYPIMPRRATVGDTEEAAAYDNNPIGAGIMRLEKHVQASVMSFERFDDYYYQPDNGFPEDKRVKFQSLDLFLVPEEATRVAAVRAGEADIVPASLATKQQVEAGGGRIVFGQEGVAVEAKLYGCWEPQYPCHDKWVRQALDYAIDKELIRDRLYGGPEAFQVKGWFSITPTTIGYTPELDPWSFDPDKARQLLADAGYPGGQGFGKLIVNTNPSTAMPFQVEAAQLAAEFWRRELGLDVEVRVGDSAGLNEMARAGELNGQLLWKDNETQVDPTIVIINRYGDPESPTRLHDDPELFRLVQQETFQILDPDKRAEATKKLLLRLRDESHMLGIGYANIPWGVGPRVVTWEPYPLAGYPSALHTITLK